MPHPVSGYILTFNEERCIQASVSSLSKYVDQIVVLDAGSTDSTLSCISNLNIRVPVDIVTLPQNSPRYSYKESYRRNICLDLCKYDWVLTLDADEVLDDSPADFYMNSVCNLKFIRLNLLTESDYIVEYHPKGKQETWYPDWQVRFFNKKVSHYPNADNGATPADSLGYLIFNELTEVSRYKLWHAHALVRKNRNNWHLDRNRHEYVSTKPVTDPLPEHFSLIHRISASADHYVGPHFAR